MLQSLITTLHDAPAFAAQYALIGDAWVLEAAAAHEDAPYHINTELAQAEINMQGDQADAMLAVIACLRDIAHEDRHDANTPIHPQALLHCERIRQADIAVFTLKCAWQMREAGDYDLWRAVLAGPIGDMAVIFQNIAEFDLLDPGMEDALEAAFTHWYCDHDRVGETDRVTLSMMDVMMEDEDHALSLQVSRHLARADLVAYGRQPDTNLTYLSRIAHHLQSDPYFAGMENTVNRTYLLHILRDLETIRVHDVAFRDGDLAQRLFPSGEILAYT